MPIITVDTGVLTRIVLTRILAELDAADFPVRLHHEDDPAGVAFVRLHPVLETPSRTQPGDADLRGVTLRLTVQVPRAVLVIAPYTLHERCHAVKAALAGQTLEAESHRLVVERGTVQINDAPGESLEMHDGQVTLAAYAERLGP